MTRPAPGDRLVRFAFTTYSAPDLTIEEHARVAREIGCEALEIRMLAGQPLPPDVPPAERRRIADVVSAAGLSICVVGSDCRFAQPTKEERSREVDRAQGFIELARDWNTPLVRVFGGRYDQSIPDGEANGWVIEGLGAAAKIAEQYGVRLALETHDYFNSAARVGSVVRAVDHPNAAVIWDLGHTHGVGESTAEAWEAIGPFVAHVHVKDIVRANGVSPTVPAGTGDVPLAEIVGVLGEAGYDGFLSTEWEPRDETDGGGREAALAQYADHLRSILAAA